MSPVRLLNPDSRHSSADHMPHAGLGCFGHPRAGRCPSPGQEAPGVHILLRGLAVVLHRRTAAHQVPVSGDVVDPPDRRPVLVLPEVTQGEEGLLLRIRTRPGALEQQVMGVGAAARRSCSWHRAKIRCLSPHVGHAPIFSTLSSGADSQDGGANGLTVILSGPTESDLTV